MMFFYAHPFKTSFYHVVFVHYCSVIATSKKPLETAVFIPSQLTPQCSWWRRWRCEWCSNGSASPRASCPLWKGQFFSGVNCSSIINQLINYHCPNWCHCKISLLSLIIIVSRDHCFIYLFLPPIDEFQWHLSRQSCFFKLSLRKASVSHLKLPTVVFPKNNHQTSSPFTQLRLAAAAHAASWPGSASPGGTSSPAALGRSWALWPGDDKTRSRKTPGLEYFWQIYYMFKLYMNFDCQLPYVDPICCWNCFVKNDVVALIRSIVVAIFGCSNSRDCGFSPVAPISQRTKHGKGEPPNLKRNLDLLN